MGNYHVFIIMVVFLLAAKTASWCGAPLPAWSHMTGSLAQPKSRWPRTCWWPSSGAAAWWRASVWWSGWASSATTWEATGQLRSRLLQLPFQCLLFLAFKFAKCGFCLLNCFTWSWRNTWLVCFPFLIHSWAFKLSRCQIVACDELVSTKQYERNN